MAAPDSRVRISMRAHRALVNWINSSVPPADREVRDEIAAAGLTPEPHKAPAAPPRRTKRKRPAPASTATAVDAAAPERTIPPLPVPTLSVTFP